MANTQFKFLLVTIFLFLSGCQSETSSGSCDELSMQKFRGVPMANKRFEEKCQNAKISYTAQVCQSALVKLMHTHDLKEVKQEFGNPIEQCFTEADLKRFYKN